jgi:hypothetical protein
MRRLTSLCFALGALLLVPGAAAAADQDGCPAAAGGWTRALVSVAAAEFFDHLVPGQFATVAEFAAAIDATSDKDGDDWICRKSMWGADLNPQSHWYRVGFELGLGEPVHLLLVIDDRANAQ